MKFTAWVSIGSIFVFVLSFTAWIFLVSDYLKASDIDVMGVRMEVTKESDEKLLTGGITSGDVILEQSLIFDGSELEELSKEEVVIPRKNEGVGKTYARAKAAIVVDADSEEVLHDQNAEERMPIASLTKLMTALVVIDNIKNLKENIVTIDKEVCSVPTSIIGCPSSSHCFSDTLQVGEKVRANDLFEAMIVNSTNDAAVALGKNIAGSQKEFTKLMNKKAKEIGLKNTNFCNPSGLDDDDNPDSCYSTAKDVAQIAIYTLKNDKYKDIWRIFKIKERWFKSIDGKKEHRYANTNILLDSMSNCVGAKTGFTYQAGKTLMMIASHPQNKNKKIVTVLLNDPYRFEDAQQLFNWTFENYIWEQETSRIKNF